MKNGKFTLLSPLKEEDLRFSFGVSRQVSGIIDPDELFAPTIAHFKKLAIGTYFWFVAALAKWTVHSAGGMLEEMTPMKETEFVKQSPEILFKNTHPEDVPKVLAFTTYWVNFFSNISPERKPHVRATIYLRLLNKKKVYSWVMIQYSDTVVDDNGAIIYGLTFVTDISHIKNDGVAMMSILDTFDNSCQQFLCIDDKNLSYPADTLPKITSREIEILRYLAIGYSSKQIAEELNIAVKTIDNHRQNMLRKTNTKSSPELVAFGINSGFI